MKKIINYFKESYYELTKKVSWPTWDKLQSSAILVMVASVIFAIVIICTSKIAGFSGVIASQPISDFLTALVAVMILLQWKKKALAD